MLMLNTDPALHEPDRRLALEDGVAATPNCRAPRCTRTEHGPLLREYRSAWQGQGQGQGRVARPPPPLGDDRRSFRSDNDETSRRCSLKNQSAGFPTEIWTDPRVAVLIERRFGVHYHVDHIGRLLHELGWSQQKPARRAVERDEGAIRRWMHKTWPRARKRHAPGCGERLYRRNGFLMGPLVHRSWARRGHTPVLMQRGHSRRKASVIGALTNPPTRRVIWLSYRTSCRILDSRDKFPRAKVLSWDSAARLWDALTR